MRTDVGESSSSQKAIRIVVVGEERTGKSILIRAAARNTFSFDIPHVLPQTNLPPGFFSERNPTTIIDTSSRMDDRGKVIKEIKKADAIVLTFAFHRLVTLERLSIYWLPLVRQLLVRVPIIVAGYKYDCNETSIEQIIAPIMQSNPEIETAFEWSATTLNQAREVIHYAQNAVIYPMEPLYDRRTKTLTHRCVAALVRIFLLSDEDKDNILNDTELNEFQVKCFNFSLGLIEIRKIRKDMQINCPRGLNEEGITILGFFYLCKKFVEDARIRTLWIILRKFGYNNDVRLADHMIPYSSFKCKADQSVELTYDAISFLRKMFVLYDQDGDNILKPHEVDYLFVTAPDKSPWKKAPYKDAVQKTMDGGLTCEGFILLWSLMTLIDPAKSLEYLIYLRYPEDISYAVHVTRERSLDRQEEICKRNVVQCFVFGPENAGKSALLNGSIGRSYDDKDIGSAEERYAVCYMLARELLPAKKALVMKEIQIEEDGLLLSNEALGACDVALFIFDSSDESSWKRCIDLLVKVATTAKEAGFEFPCLMASAKTDLDPFPMEREEFFRVTQVDLGIDMPLPICSKYGYINSLILKILLAAKHPNLNIPVIDDIKKERSWKLINRSSMVVSIGAAAFLVGLVSNCLHNARKQS